MRRDYEFRIATMQSRIASLERGIEDSDVRARQLEQSDQRINQLEDDLDKFRRVSFVTTSILVLSSVCVADRGTKRCNVGSPEGIGQSA
jgi:hypothetical protein